MRNVRTATLITVLLIGVAARTDAPEYLYSAPVVTTEKPISGKWISGSVGIDWSDVQTTPGLIFGVSLPSKYADPTAILSGDWNPDQATRAVVHVGTTPTQCCHEVELRLRTTITPHSITGYEVICSLVPDHPYIQIVRWNGRLNDFAYLPKQASYFCKDGDVLTATVVGSNFTVGLNGQPVLTTMDDKFRSGSPGVGFYDNVDNNWANFGFSEFDAGTP